jgi:glycosyltransferase involved in cell wall biosynthesis
MKITFLQDDFPPQSFGGAGISSYELALELKRLGHFVSVITTCRKPEEEGETEYNGLKIYKITTDYHERWRAYVSLNNVPVVKKVEEILERERPDIVHANNIHQYLSYASLKSAKKYAKGVVLTLRDTMPITYGKLQTKRYLENLDPHITFMDNLRDARKRWNPFRNFLIKRYLRYVDQIVAISRAVRNAFVANGIKDIKVIYNGLNIDDWIIDPHKAEEFRDKYGLKGKKVILFNGRLSAAKGGDKVVEALKLVCGDVPEALLLVVGKMDEYATIMKDKARSLGIEDNLVFTGWIERNDVRVTYGLSDVVLMPSLYLEPFGRINLEAMLSRKPVVGTCFGGVPEIVEDGVTGYVVNPHNSGLMAAKITELLLDTDKNLSFGNAGYERAVKYFNLKDKVEEYVGLYQTLARQ